MSGSTEVNANLSMWALTTHKRLEAAMDNHIKESANFAKANHPWNNLTGSATEGISGQTDAGPAQIVSSVGHHVGHGLYLETAGMFGGKYKILERARSNNLVGLWTRLRAIMSGAGFVRGG